MTWQRIDENTFIDDTLVTCAEYQLFIDEMREQGKYYQPDHWTSYQFPEGHARDPILGMRHSDVDAFCEWVTQRDNEGWDYRLPTEAEAKPFPIKILTRNIFGYWLIGDDPTEPSQFVWIGKYPKSTRGLRRDIILSDSLRRENTFKNYLSRSEIIGLMHELSIPRDNILDRDATFDRVCESALDLAICCGRKCVQEQYYVNIEDRSPATQLINHLLFRIKWFMDLLAVPFKKYFRFDRLVFRIRWFKTSLATKFPWYGNLILKSINFRYMIYHRLAKNQNRERVLDFDFAIKRTLDLSHNRALDIDFTLQRAHILDHSGFEEWDLQLFQFLDFYIDIITLQERIAGRSPAFEGIRLVKERMR